MPKRFAAIRLQELRLHRRATRIRDSFQLNPNEGAIGKLYRRVHCARSRPLFQFGICHIYPGGPKVWRERVDGSKPDFFAHPFVAHSPGDARRTLSLCRLAAALVASRYVKLVRIRYFSAVAFARVSIYRTPLDAANRINIADICYIYGLAILKPGLAHLRAYRDSAGDKWRLLGGFRRCCWRLQWQARRIP